jgi:hypothetical protein
MSLSKRVVVVSSDVTDALNQEIQADMDGRRAALQAATEAVEDAVERFGQGEQDFFEISHTLWSLLMVVGLKAVELVWATRRRPVTTNSVRDVKGRKYRYRGEKSYVLRCMFGSGQVTGPQFVRGKDGRRGREICPQMQRMGVLSAGGALDPKLALECAHMASQMPFDSAKAQLERLLPYVPSKRSLMGMADRLAPLALEVLKARDLPSGELIFVQFDGRGLPRMSEEELRKRCTPHQKGDAARPRRRRNRSRILDTRIEVGKNRTKTQEVSVAIVYALRRRVDDEGKEHWEPAGEKQYFARMGDRAAVLAHVSDQLARLESQPERIIFLTDGAKHYEDLHATYLPQAEHVVDYYHVCEYLWEAAAAICSAKEERRAWVAVAKGFLLKGESSATLALLKIGRLGIPTRGPGTKERRERVDAAIGYIEKRQDKMPYDELLEQGLEIGSGAIESAVRQVVALRFDGPGMRWGEQRPNKMLDLVCVRLSGGWKELETALRRNLRSEGRDVTRMTPIGVAEQRAQAAAA